MEYVSRGTKVMQNWKTMELFKRDKNIESKIYSITDQIANLRMMVKKSSSSAGEKKREGGQKIVDTILSSSTARSPVILP